MTGFTTSPVPPDTVFAPTQRESTKGGSLPAVVGVRSQEAGVRRPGGNITERGFSNPRANEKPLKSTPLRSHDAYVVSRREAKAYALQRSEFSVPSPRSGTASHAQPMGCQ